MIKLNVSSSAQPFINAFYLLEIGEMVISAFIRVGLIGLGPASRVLSSNNQNICMPPYDLVFKHYLANLSRLYTLLLIHVHVRQPTQPTRFNPAMWKDHKQDCGVKLYYAKNSTLRTIATTIRPCELGK